jgi:hypothetical protein
VNNVRITRKIDMLKHVVNTYLMEQEVLLYLPKADSLSN